MEGKGRPGGVVQIVDRSLGTQTWDALNFKVRSDGTFSGTLPDLTAGDVLMLRERYANHALGGWQIVEAPDQGLDRRNAPLSSSGISVNIVGKKLRVRMSPRVSEPGARIQVTNLRTGEKATVRLDDQAFGHSLELTLDGRAGDVLSVAVSDGTNNVDFSREACRLTAGHLPNPTPDLVPDPPSLKAEGHPSKERFSGPLVSPDFGLKDFDQGRVGDCYLIAGLASLWKKDPEAVERMVQKHSDGTYTVTFKSFEIPKEVSKGPGPGGTFILGGEPYHGDPKAIRWKDVPIRVDGDLYVDPDGKPIYARGRGTDDPRRQMPLLLPLIEKAYAQWKGGYRAINKGGYGSYAFSAVLGKPTVYADLSSNMDRAWEVIHGALDQGDPVCLTAAAISHGGGRNRPGLMTNHIYSVLGCSKVGNDRYLILRNPWGSTEPISEGPGGKKLYAKNDGIFRMSMADAAKTFTGYETVLGPTLINEYFRDEATSD